MKVRYRQTFYAVTLVIADIVTILLSLRFAYWLKFESELFASPFGIPSYAAYSQTFALTVIFMIAVYRSYGLYMEDKISSVSNESGLIIRATSLTFLFLMALSFFYRGFSFSRGYMLTAWACVPLGVIAVRTFIGMLYMSYRRSRNKLKEILLIGTDRELMSFALRASRQPRRCIRIAGILADGKSAGSVHHSIPVLGSPQDLEKILNQHPNINEVLLAGEKMSLDNITHMMTLCEKNLVSFKWSPDAIGMIATQMRMGHELGLPLLSLKESPLHDWENRVLKRTMDVACSLLGLIVLSPLLTLLAVLVKLDSRGPVFYRQERVGEDGKVFNVYKFRTMRQNAESESGPVWAVKDDDRRTRIGSWLRQTNLDELPQLWNIFIGDMSLVGPRPERPHFVGQFKENIPYYMGRHQIKSGLTGWAQVHGLRGNTSIEERTKYDLYYIENWSIFLDIRILFMTFSAFKNAY